MSKPEQNELNKELHRVCSSWCEDTQKVQELLELGADLENLDEQGHTPLTNACERVHYKTIELLLNLGANKNILNKAGQSPLLKACYGNGLKYVEFLIDHGFNVNIANSDGTTPFLATCEKGNINILKLLFNKGADIEQKNNQGQSALLIAVKQNKYQIVKWLLEHGANPLAPDIDSKNAFDIILEEPYEFNNNQIVNKKAIQEISNFLLKHLVTDFARQIEQLKDQIDELGRQVKDIIPPSNKMINVSVSIIISSSLDDNYSIKQTGGQKLFFDENSGE